MSASGRQLQKTSKREIKDGIRNVVRVVFFILVAPVGCSVRQRKKAQRRCDTLWSGLTFLPKSEGACQTAVHLQSQLSHLLFAGGR